MTGTRRLRLGPLPKTETVKLTFTCTVVLKEELERYAAEYGRVYEPVDVPTLIPHMLEAFMARDRGFKRAGRRGAPQDARARRRPGMNGTVLPGGAPAQIICKKEQKVLAFDYGLGG